MTTEDSSRCGASLRLQGKLYGTVGEVELLKTSVDQKVLSPRPWTLSYLSCWNFFCFDLIVTLVPSKIVTAIFILVVLQLRNFGYF